MKLGWRFRDAESIIRTETRDIVFRGLRDIPSANLDLGFEVCFAACDEAHSLRWYVLSHWLDNVLKAAMLTIPNSQLAIISNPPTMPLPAFKKRFYSNPTVTKIHVTPADNPGIKPEQLRKFMEAEAKELGFKSIEDALENCPSFRRNYKGEWIEDTGKIVFSQERVQQYKDVPLTHLPAVLGVDLGGGSAKDALAVIVYSQYERKAWVDYEKELDTSDEDVEYLADAIKKVLVLYPKIEKIVIDTGGLGDRIANILTYRYDLPFIMPAIKKDKMAHIAEVRAEFYRGRLLLKEDSLFYKELPQIIYTEDKEGIDDVAGIHSDLLDAVCYAMRHVFNAYPEPKPKKPTYREQRLAELSSRRRGRRKIGV